MANVLIERDTMTAIANAIREKTSTTDTYKPVEMVDAIKSISGGGSSDPTDPDEYIRTHRPTNWPFIPHPKELMDETSPYYEPDDVIYLLCDASAYSCVAGFTPTATSPSMTVYKYNDTELVGSEEVTISSGTNYYEDWGRKEDYNTYNYLVFCIESSSITTLKLIYFNSLEEVRMKCEDCTFDIGAASNVNSKIYFKYLLANKAKLNKVFKGNFKFLVLSTINRNINTIDMSYTFAGCCSLQSIPKLDISKATRTARMFDGCYSLQSIPQLDISRVTEIGSMFNDCHSLQSIPQLDTSKATSMTSMFNSCRSLQSIPQLDTSKATSMTSMFNSCYSLSSVDLTKYPSTTSTSTTISMFSDCYSLKRVIFRSIPENYVLHSSAFNNCYHLTGTVDATYNPNGDKDGFIYVPDDMVETLKTESNWSVYASQIKGLSELEED